MSHLHSRLTTNCWKTCGCYFCNKRQLLKFAGLFCAIILPRVLCHINIRCDRSISLGLSMGNISKILKCAGNDDTVTLKAEDSADTLTIMFESPSELESQDSVLPRRAIPVLNVSASSHIRATFVCMKRARSSTRICRSVVFEIQICPFVVEDRSSLRWENEGSWKRCLPVVRRSFNSRRHI